MIPDDFFDIDVPMQIVERLAHRLNADGYSLDETRWLQKQSIDFYKGMYASIRVVASLDGVKNNPSLHDLAMALSLDCIQIINDKSKKT